jgi:predicted ATPase
MNQLAAVLSFFRRPALGRSRPARRIGANLPSRHTTRRYLPFKHALVQDAAYKSLLRTTRRHYHAQIARLFEQRFPEIAETQPELVAHHYTEAGDPEQALRYWHQAGRHAVRRSANAETIGHLTRGLKISRLPTVSAHT